jgi:hypothetical protein
MNRQTEPGQIRVGSGFDSSRNPLFEMLMPNTSGRVPTTQIVADPDSQKQNPKPKLRALLG